MRQEIDGLRAATAGDAAALHRLINLAFEKESFFKKGDRTDEQQVRDKMLTGCFYLIERERAIVACVYLEVANASNPALLARGEGAGYIGMLAVHPSHQGRGLGKSLMEFGEAELQRRGCQEVQIRIIHLRTELLEFYSALGYREAGQSPYLYPEKTTMPVHFLDMKKKIEPAG